MVSYTPRGQLADYGHGPATADANMAAYAIELAATDSTEMM